MRRIHSVVIAVLAPLLANCSTHPLVDEVTRSTTFDVVEKIRCEAKRAVMEHGQGFPNETAVAYEFTFDINETNSASGDVTWTLPLTGGAFTLRAHGGPKLERRAQRNFTITETFGDLRKANCSPEVLEKNWIYPIAGEIGIYEVVATFAQLPNIDQVHATPPDPTFSYSYHDTLTFITFLGAGLQPTLNLSPATGSRVSQATADLSAGRSDTHEVVIAFSGGRQTPTAVARRSPTASRISASRIPGIRSIQGMRTNAAVPNAVATRNTQLAITLLQAGGDLRENAIRELDRARIDALQDRVQNQVVGP